MQSQRPLISSGLVHRIIDFDNAWTVHDHNLGEASVSLAFSARALGEVKFAVHVTFLRIERHMWSHKSRRTGKQSAQAAGLQQNEVQLDKAMFTLSVP